MPNDKRSIKVFRRLPTDARRALFLGDLDIEDVVDEELTNSERANLMQYIKRWGNANGVEGS
jgi:hypothetical protein